MELRIQGKRLGGTVVQKEVKRQAPGAEPSRAEKARSDRLELSRRAADFLKEQSRRVAEEMAAMGKEEEKSGQSSQLDFLKKEMDIMDKCARISASITKGDRVPPEDLRYLKAHDMNAYLLALVTRKPKRDPEDKDSVLSEEDIEELENGTQESASSASPAPTADSGGAGPA